MARIKALQRFASILITVSIASCSSVEIEIAPEAHYQPPKIIAHCGYWDVEGSAENSIASLRNAGEIGVFASEFDIQLTSDDVLVICHDPIINGINIHDSSLAEIRKSDNRLRNGELIPTLDDYFQEALRYPDLNLVLELKSYGEKEYEIRAINACENKIKEYQLSERIIFISFSLTACQSLKRIFKKNTVLYLNSDKTPKELFELGLDGLNCHYSYYNSHPNWIYDTIKLGMHSGAWTVDQEEDIAMLIEKGVEFITTNSPMMALNYVADNAKLIDDRTNI